MHIQQSVDQVVQTTLVAVFFSMELSQSKWLVTYVAPGCGERMSKHVLIAGDVTGLFEQLERVRNKAYLKTGQHYPMVSIQEAGLDGFWIHCLLVKEGIESHVVYPASITTSRRRRRTKTDKIDGEALLRTLLAFKRGDPAGAHKALVDQHYVSTGLRRGDGSPASCHAAADDQHIGMEINLLSLHSAAIAGSSRRPRL